MEYIEALCDNCGRLLGVPINLTNHKCGGKLIPLELDHDDYITLCKIWSTGNEVDYTVHWDLYNAMVELKKNDIIEYNLKMSQFRNQVEQQKNASQASSNTIKCPTCNSTKVKRISGTAKVAGAVAFGLLSKTAKSQFKCENCGYKW